MMTSEIVFTPDEYIPFKRRIRRAFMSSAVLTIAIYAAAILKSYGFNNSFHIASPLPFYTVLAGVFVMFFILLCIRQYKTLDSLVIDTEKRTLKIVLRKKDEPFVKGIYELNSISLSLTPRLKSARKLNFKFVIRNRPKILWQESNMLPLNLTPWNADLFQQVMDTFKELNGYQVSK
jgi:hypothetical protein